MSATGLAITNPLVKYRALVATKTISPDQGQFRLALHLQKLYDRLKDYEPQIEYSHRLDQISRAVRDPNDDPNGNSNPPPQRNSWRSLLAAREKRDSLALTRKLTSHESALQLSSPRGLMLHGEVGTGKSMLIDLFADCLPNRKKRRWHFNTFMLETFSKLETLRRQRSSSVSMHGEQDYPLLWLARDMIHTSPILFLDEFQMPDRVASKILTNLMTSFFHLGGVLIATSNRMPEELAKASGVDFAASPSRLDALGLRFGFRPKKVSLGMYAGQSEFAAFLDVLKARCEVWEMEGGKDYRRVESGSVTPERVGVDGESDWELDGHDDLQSIKSSLERNLDVDSAASTAQEHTPTTPLHYLLSDSSELEKRESYTAALQQATGDSTDLIKFIPSTMKVYGRTIIIPRTYKGLTEWTFPDLCKTTLGPADYITLASTYHTLILQDVPILTTLLKNEARRFITLLDALYECRCKLYITAAAGPDDLFFPEKQGSTGSDETGDAIQSETFSEAYQDATAPFRPNILTENPNYAEPNPEPDFTHARLAGLLNADALEDEPPNKPARSTREAKRNPFGRSFGRTDAEIGRAPIDPDEQRISRGRGVDFGRTSAFTGEDEKFAYKRAQSRLWELCGARWWARSEEGWHRPLPAEVRRWERSVDDRADRSDRFARSVGGSGDGAHVANSSDVSVGGAVVDETRDERMFRHGGSPFRTEREPPPKLSWVHAWGMMRWGAKAGAWGEGVDGLKNRGGEKR